MIRLERVNKYFNRRKSNEIHVINNTSLELPETGIVTPSKYPLQTAWHKDPSGRKCWPWWRRYAVRTGGWCGKI